MFTSKLTRIIDEHDPLGIFRVHGIKVVYVSLILFAINGFFSIPHPYFYFFYVPLTAMTAEVQGTTLPQKYVFFSGVTMGSLLVISLFNLFFPFPAFFLLCSFGITWLLYVYLLQDQNKLFWVPIILSLASYSLNYRAINGNPFEILNNAITIVVSMLVILGALLLFPLSFYYRVWLRAFHRVVALSLKNFLILQSGSAAVTDIPAYIAQMRLYAGMLPRCFPTYSILNMTFHIHKLYLTSCVYWAPKPLFTAAEIAEIVALLQQLVVAIEQEKPCMIEKNQRNTIHKIIHSWNYCAKHI